MAATRNHVSQLEYKGMRFLITDRPTDTSLDKYISILKENKVNALVRVCEPTYARETVESAGIKDLAFEDGDPPPENVIQEWFRLMDEVFRTKDACVAVHCVAGLGRAPVMVALSLIEGGMSPEDAVLYIRDRRKGAINSRQLVFLNKYKRRSKDKKDCVCM